jgi:hypothetical protein
MERVLARLNAWKGLYDELQRMNAQLAAEEQADGATRHVEDLKVEMARLSARADAALDAVHEAITQRRPLSS